MVVYLYDYEYCNGDAIALLSNLLIPQETIRMVLNVLDLELSLINVLISVSLSLVDIISLTHDTTL